MVALAVGFALVPAPFGGPGTGGPAGAATATLRHLRSVDIGLDTVTVPTGTPEYYSSPALADLNSDDKPELVVAAPNGTVTATRIDNGARLWQRDLGVTALQASPLVTDVDNNGQVDVVAATMDGRVVLLNGQTGALVRTFRQGAPQFCPPGNDCRPDGFFATPVVADVNRDGRNDIIAASYDHSVYAWSHGGTLLWRSFLYDTLWSSPAVVDLDRNGTPEVVLGGDIYAGNPLGTPAGGLLWALNGSNGSRFSGYPISLPGQTTWSSPAITDLDGDGRVEAVVGTGNNGPYGDGPVQRRVYAITLATRRNLPGWPVTAPGRVVHQPAVGDITGDGRPEVVVGTEGGYVAAYAHTGYRRWAVCNSSAEYPQCPSAPSHGGAVIADVDDDGSQEVISTLEQRVRVFNGPNGAIEAQFRLTGGNLSIAPTSIAAVGEINGSTVVAQSYIVRDLGGPVQAGRASIRTDLLTTDKPLCAEDWPGFKRDAQRRSLRPERPPWHPLRCGRPFVAQQYRDLLGRDLDTAGATFWTARLRTTTWSGARVVEGFLNSREFGAVAAPIVRIHLGLKGGPPLPSTEIRAQMQAVRHGASFESVAAGLVDDQPWAAQSDAQFIDGVFTRLMGRAPNAAERASAVAAVQSDGRAAWLNDLAQSAWPVGRLRGQVNVAMTYIGLLDRGPDQSGWDFWVRAVNTGTSPQRLIEQFLASTEYRDRVS